MESKLYLEPVYKFQHPCSIILSGVSMSGKSTFAKNLIQNLSMFSEIPKRVLYSYSEDQPLYEQMNHHNISFVKGLDFNMECTDNEPTLLIVDDQMAESGKDNMIRNLFTKGVHHKNISLLYITQNLYHQGKYSRDMRLNAHYLIIFKSPTFVSQVQHLNRQLFPSHPRFLVEAYKNATITPYSYLFINLHPHCEDELRVRSGILPSENEIIYTPK